MRTSSPSVHHVVEVKVFITELPLRAHVHPPAPLVWQPAAYRLPSGQSSVVQMQRAGFPVSRALRGQTTAEGVISVVPHPPTMTKTSPKKNVRIGARYHEAPRLTRIVAAGR